MLQYQHICGQILPLVSLLPLSIPFKHFLLSNTRSVQTASVV
jgi:hypothetical protein